MNIKHRHIALVITLGIVVLFFAGIFQSNGDTDLSQTIQTFITEKADATLSLRSWMQAKNIDAIRLLNKSNKRYGNGVSIQTEKLFCFFEGSGTDELFDVKTMEQVSSVMEKSFELTGWAKEYGAYAYIRHDEAFEVKISSDPVNRPGGVEGTAIINSDLSEQELKTLGIERGESLGGDWFLAVEKQKPIVIDTKSDLFRMTLVLAVWG